MSENVNTPPFNRPQALAQMRHIAFHPSYGDSHQGMIGFFIKHDTSYHCVVYVSAGTSSVLNHVRSDDEIVANFPGLLTVDPTGFINNVSKQMKDFVPIRVANIRRLNPNWLPNDVQVRVDWHRANGRQPKIPRIGPEEVDAMSLSGQSTRSAAMSLETQMGQMNFSGDASVADASMASVHAGMHPAFPQGQGGGPAFFFGAQGLPYQHANNAGMPPPSPIRSAQASPLNASPSSHHSVSQNLFPGGMQGLAFSIGGGADGLRSASPGLGVPPLPPRYPEVPGSNGSSFAQRASPSGDSSSFMSPPAAPGSTGSAARTGGTGGSSGARASAHAGGSTGSASPYERSANVFLQQPQSTKKKRKMNEEERHFQGEQMNSEPLSSDLSDVAKITNEFVANNSDMRISDFAAILASSVEQLLGTTVGDQPHPIMKLLAGASKEEASDLMNLAIKHCDRDDRRLQNDLENKAKAAGGAVPAADAQASTFERQLDFSKQERAGSEVTIKGWEKDLVDYKKQEPIVKEVRQVVTDAKTRLSFVQQVCACTSREGPQWNKLAFAILKESGLDVNDGVRKKFFSEDVEKDYDDWKKIQAGNLVGLDFDAEMSDEVTKLTEHSADYIGKAPDSTESDDASAVAFAAAARTMHHIKFPWPGDKAMPVLPEQQPTAHAASAEATAKDKSVKAAPSVGALPNMDLSIAATVSGSQAMSASVGSVRSMSLPPAPAPQAASKGASTKLPPSHQQAANPSDASSLMDMTGLTTEAGSTAVSGSLGEVDSVSMPSLPPAPAPQAASEGAATKPPPSHQPVRKAEPKVPSDSSTLGEDSTLSDVGSLPLTVDSFTTGPSL